MTLACIRPWDSRHAGCTRFQGSFLSKQMEAFVHFDVPPDLQRILDPLRDVPVEEAGFILQRLKNQPCHKRLASGAFGVTWKVCYYGIPDGDPPCRMCVVVKIPKMLDISMSEYIIQRDLYAALRASRSIASQAMAVALKYVAYDELSSGDLSGGKVRGGITPFLFSMGIGDPVGDLERPGGPVNVPDSLMDDSLVDLPSPPRIDRARIVQIKHALFQNLVDGEPFSKVCTDLSFNHFREVVFQVLTFCHHSQLVLPGFKHNDLHLSNILVDTSDTVAKACVLDFGLAETATMFPSFMDSGIQIARQAGNYDAWKFLGHILHRLVRETDFVQWQAHFIMFLRRHLHVDEFQYICRTTVLQSPRLWSLMRTVGPFVIAPGAIGCDPFNYPIVRTATGWDLLPGAREFNLRHPLEPLLRDPMFTL